MNVKQGGECRASPGERRSSRRLWLVGGVLLIVAVNAWSYARRESVARKEPAFQPSEKALERQRRRLKWEAGAVTALESPDLRERLSGLRFQNCVPVPSGGVPESIDSLPYLWRFVWSDRAAKWQPLLLVAVLVDDVPVGTLGF